MSKKNSSNDSWMVFAALFAFLLYDHLNDHDSVVYCEEPIVQIRWHESELITDNNSDTSDVILQYRL